MMQEPRWQSVPYGFGWQRTGDPSTDTADNMVADYEAALQERQEAMVKAKNWAIECELIIENLQQESEQLTSILAAILDDATGDAANADKRLWPIRAAHYREARKLVPRAEG